MTPAASRQVAAYLRSAHGMSERRACRVMGCDRASIRYRPKRPDDAELRERLKALAQAAQSAAADRHAWAIFDNTASGYATANAARLLELLGRTPARAGP